MLEFREPSPLRFTQAIPNDPDGRCESDAIRVGGVWTPGLVVISKAGIPYTWDKRKGYGYGGAWLVFTGDDLNEFDTTFTIWKDSHERSWDKFAKTNLTKLPVQQQLNSAFLPNLPKPKALGVYNPILAELQIVSIVPKFIGQWVAGTGRSRGKWSKTIQWIVFKAPVPLLGKPNSAIPDTAKKQPTASDAQEIENQAKRAQIEAKQAILARGSQPARGPKGISQ